MAVDPIEFDLMRQAAEDFLEKAYAESPEPPIETEPGHWFLWPARRVEFTVEEARHHAWGTPGEGTGRLQIRVKWPYSDHRFRRGGRTGRDVDKLNRSIVEDAVEYVKKTSVDLERRYGLDNLGAQAAYEFGYNAIQDLPESEAKRVIEVREKALKGRRWESFHVELARLEQASRAGGSPLWAVASADPKGADMFVWGIHSGLDDREFGVRRALREPQTPPGVKEWRPKGPGLSGTDVDPSALRPGMEIVYSEDGRQWEAVVLEDLGRAVRIETTPIPFYFGPRNILPELIRPQDVVPEVTVLGYGLAQALRARGELPNGRETPYGGPFLAWALAEPMPFEDLIRICDGIAPGDPMCWKTSSTVRKWPVLRSGGRWSEGALEGAKEWRPGS